MPPFKIKRQKRQVPKGSRKGMGGAKNLFKPEYTKKLLNYFSKTPYEIVTMPDNTTKVRAVTFPTFEEFANEKLHVSVQTMRNWAKHNADFLEAMMRAKEYQARFLIQNGLKGIISTTWAKFVAINCTDLRDKQEIIQTNLYPEGLKVKWIDATPPVNKDANA